MRIAIVSTLLYETWGGSEVLWSQMAMHALSTGHQVAAMSFQPTDGIPPWSQLRDAGATLLQPPRGSLGLGGLYRRANRLLDRVSDPYAPLLRWKPDVILVNQAATYDVALSSRLRPLADVIAREKIPHVVVCQMTEDNYFPPREPRELTDRFFSSAASVAFVAEHNRRVVERQLAHVLSNAVVIRNPVNLTDDSAMPWPVTDQTQLACVGRLDVSAKGQDVLLEALAAISGNWKLNIYGRGHDEEYLKSLVKRYSLTGRVAFAGHVDSIRQVWADNHMLLVPSRFEGTPLSLVEAMLCGRPALVTRVGGNTEWIAEPKTGFIAEAPTVESVADALDRAFNAKESWPGMGVAAHDTAVKLRDPSPIKTMLSLVERAASGKADK